MASKDSQVRHPDFKRDGWCLEDGEERNRESPSSFWIPDLNLRKSLAKGEFAQLIFKIAVDGDEEFVERMWVIVRERVNGGYIGMLDNKPSSITENDQFWLGAELPFEYRHIIDISAGNASSKALADAPPPIPWI